MSSRPLASRRLRATTTFAITVVALVTGVLLAMAAPASAHVEAEATSITPDGTATVVFSFDHGCDGAATTSIRVKTPTEASDVQLEQVPGWTATVGNGEFSWTGGEVPDHQAASFTATMHVYGEAGSTISFPTVQGCTGGAEEAWIEIQQPGQPEPEHVAPSIELTETIAAPATTAAPSTAPAPTTAAPATTLSTSPVGDSGSSSNAGLVVLLIVLAVIVIGGLVLYLRNRRAG